MYNRKIKLAGGKKKAKSTTPPGSNWGPRIALAEKEKALMSQCPNESQLKVNQQVVRKSSTGNIYTGQKGLTHLADHQQTFTRLSAPSNYKKVSISTGSSNNSHTGSSTLGNNYIYNYARKPSSSSETTKSFYLAPSSASRKTSSSGERSTYILGSSTNYGSHVTLAESSRKPLTLIIPPVSQVFSESDFEESGYNALIERDQPSFPSTRTYRSSEEEEENEDEIDVGRKYEKQGLNVYEIRGNSPNINPLPSKCEQIFSNPAINLGILKVSTTKPLIHNYSPDSITTDDIDIDSAFPCLSANNVTQESNDNQRLMVKHDKSKTNQIIVDDGGQRVSNPGKSNLRRLCNGHGKSKSSIGSTISSLAQGITMVYVPMESLPRSKSAAVLNASLEYDPDISKLVSESIQQPIEEIDKQHEFSSPQNEQDPDNDSLLESFDSVMFKPRDGFKRVEQRKERSREMLSSSSSSSSSSSFISDTPSTPTQNPKLHSSNVTITNRQTKCDANATNKILPPALPPKNPGLLLLKSKLKLNDNMFANIAKKQNPQPPNFKGTQQSKSQQREIIMRAAVDNLDNIIRPQSSTPKPSEVLVLNDSNKEKSNKRVTLAIPNQELLREHELLNNLRNDNGTSEIDEIDAYSSSFFTCGHVLKEDDYSTLSSTHSPTRNDLNNDDLDDNHPQNTIASSSSVNSFSSGEITPKTAKEKNRSVLQQLRELSILIGGSGENEKIQRIIAKSINDKGVQSKSFRLHEEDPTRKLSDATDNSADSGKGSGTCSSGATSSGSSPKSFQSSPDSLRIPQQENQLKYCHNNFSSACVFKSDCNECLMYNKPLEGFAKPNSSEVICGKAPKGLNRKNSTKRSIIPSKIVRRKSSKSSKSSKTSSKYKKKKKQHLVFEYCDCIACGCNNGNANNTNTNLAEGPILSNLSEKNRNISVTSSSSGHSTVKLSRSVAFRSSSRSNSTTRPTIKSSPPLSNSDLSMNGLFTIEEEENQSVDSKMWKSKESLLYGSKREISRNWHPDCGLLAADPMLGWSDMESLYDNSMNMKNGDKPLGINEECWTCWQEISEMKNRSENPNGTVDRTKRMFIWLNKRHKEFEAPWWEAKKQASIRWIMTKALIHVPKEYLIDPFKESKNTKPTKYILRDEVISGLIKGKFYSLAIANLYQTVGEEGYPAHGLCHWEIIKILSRRGVYVAQPSDMKLTQGTLRHKPIRIAAHIALIEAIMLLYSKEIISRERMLSVLYAFGCTVKSDTTLPDDLVIAWINAAVMTLKSFIISTKNHQFGLPPEKQNRWLQLPKVGEPRDLCDGIGICSLFAIYCSKDVKISDICVPEPGETLTIYDSISNHTLIQKLCEEIFPETIYHLCVTDFLYIHGYMKQNILCFLVDLFIHFEINPVVRVQRLTN